MKKCVNKIEYELCDDLNTSLMMKFEIFYDKWMNENSFSDALL